MKGYHFYSLLSHSLIYGLGISFILEYIGVFSIWKMLVLIISHMIIDYKKANAKNIKKSLITYLYIDQALHIIIDILMLVL